MATAKQGDGMLTARISKAQVQALQTIAKARGTNVARAFEFAIESANLALKSAPDPANEGRADGEPDGMPAAMRGEKEPPPKDNAEVIERIAEGDASPDERGTEVPAAKEKGAKINPLKIWASNSSKDSEVEEEEEPPSSKPARAKPDPAEARAEARRARVQARKGASR